VESDSTNYVIETSRISLFDTRGHILMTPKELSQLNLMLDVKNIFKYFM
jgi:hypothetical protein